MLTRLHKLILLFVIFYFSFNCSAQKTEEKFQPFITLRTNIFSLIEPHAGITLGIGYQWNKRFSATIDPTIIFFNPNENNCDNNGHPFGIKIKADTRWHFDKFILGLQRIFTAPELHFKDIVTKRWATFGINCIGQQCSYFMNSTYKEIKTEIGAALKLGIETQLDRKDRWTMELYGGMGFKVNYYKEKDIPLGGIFMPEPSHTDILGIGEGIAIPVLPGSIKISYRIF